MPDTAPPAKDSATEIASRALATGCGCAFVLPLAVLFLGIIYHIFDSRCGTPGDSGGCEMGIFSAMIAAVIPGLVLGMVVSLAATWWEHRKKRKS